MIQTAALNVINEIAKVKNILETGGEWPELQERAQLFRQHLFPRVHEKAGAFFIHTDVEAVFFLLDGQVFVNAKVYLAVDDCTFIIVNADVYAFAVVVLMPQWFDCSCDGDMEIVEHIQLLNESLNGIIGQRVADEVDIHILRSTADISCQTAHDDATFDCDITA